MAITNNITGKKEYVGKVVHTFSTPCPNDSTKQLHFAMVAAEYNGNPYIKTVMYATDYDLSNSYKDGELLKTAIVDADDNANSVFRGKVNGGAAREIKTASYINEGDFVEIIGGKHKGKLGKVVRKVRDTYCWYLFVQTPSEECKVTFKVVKKSLEKQVMLRSLYE